MITYGGKIYPFENVPFYSEKNWGYSFPEKWFWINCNAFPENPDLTLTAVGSTRKVLHWTESVGIIGIHWQNRFYKFDIWNSQLTWTVQPWGYWEMRATNENYTIVLIGISDHPPDRVRVPTEKSYPQGKCKTI
jgi:tocopherol cyclase